MTITKNTSVRNWVVRAALALLMFAAYPLMDPGDAAQRYQSAATMLAAAQNFLAALTPDQAAKTKFSFSDEERLNWHFIPRARKGIPFKEMQPAQQKLAHAFLSSGLSQRGFIKATTVMSLEAILRELESGRGGTMVRDEMLYYFSVFGEPSDNKTWGWRVEGHHLSLNFTLAEGQLVASTPAFYGSNPAEVREGPRKGLRTLAGEEDRARELLQSLDDKQRAIAVTSKEAPKDILSTNTRRADIGPPVGLAAAKMTKKQVEHLMRLLEEYANNMPEDISAVRFDQLRRAGIEKIHFSWAGGSERGQPHYYRVQGPTFLVEYDNTQNNANHIHAVWRNYDGDFGLDLLGMHLKTAHSKD
jgi:hypothetical protein